LRSARIMPHDLSHRFESCVEITGKERGSMVVCLMEV
jgi:hypothetical protein